jgi:hypothetical protein
MIDRNLPAPCGRRLLPLFLRATQLKRNLKVNFASLAGAGEKPFWRDAGSGGLKVKWSGHSAAASGRRGSTTAGF